MGIYLVLAYFFICAVIWDLQIRFVKMINPGGALDFYNIFLRKTAFSTMKIVRLFTGFRFKIEYNDNISLPDNFIIISNHQSLIDIPAIIYSLPEKNIKFVAKKSLSRGIPLISIHLRVGNHISIERSGGFKKTKTELNKLSLLAREHSFCPLIFPEGTRSKNGRIKAFHSGAARYLIRTTGLPVLSVSIDGGYLLSRFKDVIKLSSRTNYRLKLLSLHDNPKTKSGIDELLDKIHSEIEHQIKQWRKSG